MIKEEKAMRPFRGLRLLWAWVLLVCLVPPLLAEPSPARAQLRFEISFPPEMSATALDGRVYLLISKDSSQEPRFQITEGPETQLIFGMDVEGWAPGAAVVVDGSVPGYPLESTNQLPAGDYYVQGLLNIYETFHRADGHVVKLPMDQGEGQQWNRKPGNLVSALQPQHLDPAAGGVVRLSLTRKIPPIEPPKDTKYLKHMRIQSRLLTQFWGRPMELGAIVLLPEGWEEHSQARYPLMVYQGHFSWDWETPVQFRDTPPTPDMKSYDRTMAEYSYKFYQDWTAGRLPRMLILCIQHPNPYYDDSYAVNSANLGPYGDAIVQELIPEVEKRFRAIGQPWARVLYGGSTGGWEALAMQVFYPDFFNGAWVFCPDPVDFRAFMTVDIYDDANAYWIEGPWLRIPRPAIRTTDGLVKATMESFNRRELVLGTRCRSGDQFAIWEAAFGPVGPDGYPKPLYDPRTGVIDRAVAAYWREHYDLSDILQRNWKTLGPKLVGKLHFKVGTRDTYYLDRAVRLAQKFLASANNPCSAADFEYGPSMPHCWSGDASVPVSISRLTINQRVMPAMAEWLEKSAPKDADVSSWKY
jgi:hypothetical protein